MYPLCAGVSGWSAAADPFNLRRTSRRPEPGKWGHERDASPRAESKITSQWLNATVPLDCQFESICETCAHFSTNTSFTPVLEPQRDHAADRDQHHRVDLFNMLLERTRTGQQMNGMRTFWDARR
jgi:hypothetical protein